MRTLIGRAAAARAERETATAASVTVHGMSGAAENVANMEGTRAELTDPDAGLEPFLGLAADLLDATA